jgi:Rrf2 family protein
MMSKKTKYAINALVYLAKAYREGPVMIGQIAKSERIPHKFLENILLVLRNAGILNSKKGRGGGYYLRKPPEEVHIAEVMRLFDGPIALLPCVSFNYYERCEECKDEAACGIRDVFIGVRDETVRRLKEATLSDIIRRENSLKSGVGSNSSSGQ